MELGLSIMESRDDGIIVVSIRGLSNYVFRHMIGTVINL